MRSLKTYLAATAAVLVATAGTAHAVPYAFSTINFSNLTLSGLTGPGVTVNSSTVTTSSSANYDGAASDAASAPGDLTTGSDVRQSASGLSIVVPQNTFTQALTGASGARGDSITAGVLGGANATASDVAEGRLTVPSSTAASAGGTSTGLNITFTLAGTSTIGLTFTAADNLVATTTAAGDGASSEVNASFSVTGAGFAGFTFAPGALNTSISASGVGGNQSFSTGPTAYSTSVVLNAGTYQLSLLSGAQERLQTGAVATPEPVSLAILGTGLVGFGLMRRRKRT